MGADWLVPSLAAGGCALAGFGVHALLGRVRSRAALRSAGDILRDARREADAVLREAELTARSELMNSREKAESDMQDRQRVLSTAADRLSKRDERIEREEQRLEERAQALDLRSRQLEEARAAVRVEQDRLEKLRDEEQRRLEALAGLSSGQARTELLARLEADLESETAARLRKAQEDARVTAEARARDIVTAAIQRHAADQVADVTTTPVRLPDDGMKGRIIGREGRNIRALEMATGVTVIIDDTPGVVVLSSFDPVRREVARVTLERLVQDGRINPVLIEETADKVTAELDDLILQAGEEAVESLRLAPVPLDLMRLLGKLKFRTSYSQNVLRHSLEAARLAGLMAPEVGLDPELARRTALFHDIGKAVDHEVEGSHAEIGADLLRRAGESETVVRAVRAHHGEAEADSAYAALVAAADAVTAARPGARLGATEVHLQRMEELEAAARAEPGVVRSLAMQAGRELRVFVEPTEIDDAAAIQLARRVSRKIEESLAYPGQIKVTVIRETRCVEYAR